MTLQPSEAPDVAPAKPRGLARLGKHARRRLVVYPSLLGLLVGGVMYCTCMPGESHGALEPPTDDEVAAGAGLRRDVEALAGAIGARNLENRDTLPRAEQHVRARMRALGYAPERQSYDVGIRSVGNLEATHAGVSKPKEIVVVGAHYDSAYDAPGADDNASGVAALLALAEAFATRRTARTVRFVAFANEEPPRFWTEAMGSLVYAKACAARGDDVRAMLSLETLGYYRDEPGTQKYPPPMSLLYSDRANFVAFVGNTSSRSLTRESVGAFRGAARFPSEGAALPGFIQGVGWSDQWSFWQVGYPAVMVTDTAPFRNPHYHKRSDTPDTLDYPRLARVVRGLAAVVGRLAGEGDAPPP
ncbi:MAG TPA: M20/M25/M40 family metallo-hydrolase [Polyangiaceae bacterium]|nr:M20/M25/M40 family metallo-hydrolase [Polyangiaceae bacterium]